MDSQNDADAVFVPLRNIHDSDKAASNDAKNDDSSKRTGSKSVYGEYAEMTTIHGISPIYLATSAYMRLFWFLIFASAVSLMSWQVWKLVGKLRGNDISSTIKTRYNRSVGFPAVTFCNTHGLISTMDFDDYERKASEGNATEEDLFKYGLSEENFLMKKVGMCFVDKKPCNFSLQFSHFVSYDFGNCFTLNAATQSNVAEDVLFALNVNIDGYSESFMSKTFSPGIVLIVHSPDEVITHNTFVKKGMFISPGTVARLGIKRQEIKRLPHPYPDRCYNKKFTNQLLGMKLKNYFRYTVNLCHTLCDLRYYRKCQLGWLNRYIEERRFLSTQERARAFGNRSIDCINELCDCPPPCDEEVFKVESTTTSWPSHPSLKLILLQLLQKGNSSFKNWTVDDIQKNLLAINVYVNDFTVETIEQFPAYDVNSFLSDLGGQLGLWIGASVYSAFELVSIVFSCIHYYVVENKRSRNHQGS